MSKQTVILAGFQPLAFQVITLSNSTAAGLNSTNLAAHRIIFTVATNPAHFRQDGTLPALTTGVALQTATVYDWQGMDPANNSALKFQRTTGTATISLQAYKVT